MDKQDLNALQDFFKQHNKVVKSDQDKMLPIIGFFLEQIDQSTWSEHDKNQMKNELNALGQFILSYNPSIKIKEVLRESPDFIVQWKNKTIGVELRELFSETANKKEEAKLQTICETTSEILLEKGETFFGTYELDFDWNEIKKQDSKKVAEEVANCIMQNATSIFLKNVLKKDGQTVYCYPKTKEITSPINLSDIANAIHQKEEKLKKYQENSGTNTQWLVLTFSESEQVFENTTVAKEIKTHVFNTSFNEVFIFSHSSKRYYRLIVE